MPRKAFRSARRHRAADIVRLIVTTREKFARDARWNRSIRRTLFRLLRPTPPKP